MKDIRIALREFLLADTAISAAVGGSAIHPNRLPQGSTGGIVSQRVSGQGNVNNGGRDGLVRTRFQITSWAATPIAAAALANLVKDRLEGFKGVMGSSDPVTVDGVFFADERDLESEKSDLVGVSRDYFVWHQEIA